MSHKLDLLVPLSVASYCLHCLDQLSIHQLLIHLECITIVFYSITPTSTPSLSNLGYLLVHELPLPSNAGSPPTIPVLTLDSPYHPLHVQLPWLPYALASLLALVHSVLHAEVVVSIIWLIWYKATIVILHFTYRLFQISTCRVTCQPFLFASHCCLAVVQNYGHSLVHDHHWRAPTGHLQHDASWSNRKWVSVLLI